MKYRKKPVVIDAFQWKNQNYEEWPDWAKKSDATVTVNVYDELYIETLEGRMKASKGDWIIRGVNGEIYPCKPDIFHKTYELAESPHLLSEERIAKDFPELSKDIDHGG